MPEDQQLKIARRVAAVLCEAGYLTYFAGGCVRDKLLGKLPQDYDIATSATPEQVCQLFPKTETVGAHFGVVLVKLGGIGQEVATFRTDGSYQDGRRPDGVNFATPAEDATRRDFTINGLFEDPTTGEIIDFVGGKADLEAQLIRAIGNPEDRFAEDSLRLLRAIRMATVTGFGIEPATWTAIQQHSTDLNRVSIERIREEFCKIMLSPARARGLDFLVESGLIGQFLPEVLPMIGCEQPPQWHPEGDVYTHTRIMLDLLAGQPPLALILATLFHDIGKPRTQTWDEAAQRLRFNGHDQVGAEMTKEIMTRLRFSNSLIEQVTNMVGRHMQFMHVKQMRNATVKRFMSSPNFAQELELHRVDCASSNGFTDNYEFLLTKQKEFANQPIIPAPLITGQDLIDLGLTPGPLFKEILNTIQTLQLDDQLSTKQQAIDHINTHLIQNNRPN